MLSDASEPRSARLVIALVAKLSGANRPKSTSETTSSFARRRGATFPCSFIIVFRLAAGQLCRTAATQIAEFDSGEVWGWEVRKTEWHHDA
jgi:hypothetical protein